MPGVSDGGVALWPNGGIYSFAACDARARAVGVRKWFERLAPRG